jgi:hypothetical protein
MTELDKEIAVFKFNVDAEQFQKIEFGEYDEFFNSDSIILIVNSLDKILWLWHGKNANVRMKFIATQEAPKIRNAYYIDYKISAVDEGNETEKFKNFFDID